MIEKYKNIKFELFNLLTFILTVAFIIWFYKDHAFMDSDTTIYTIIGKDIFNDFIMPYGSTFDHKPLVTYYIYGVLYLIFGQDNLYFYTAFIICFISSLILSGWNINKFLTIASFIFLSSALLSDFSGNTEMLMLPFISAYIITFKYDSPYRFILIGMLASILFNINYLSAPIMMPITLYMFFSNSKGLKSSIIRVFQFLTGFVLLTVLIFLPFLFTAENIIDYFSQQLQFIFGYNPTDRVDSYIKLLKAIIIFIPLMVLFLYKSKKNVSFYLTITLLIGAIFGAFASGRGYLHYLEPIVIPLSIMLWKTFSEHNKALCLATMIVPIAALIYTLNYRLPKYSLNDYILSATAQEDITHLNKLASIDSSALNIKSTHLLFLYSDVKNINKYVWHDHPQIMFGSHADDYYLKEIDNKPHLIMTKIGLCNIPSSICNQIKTYYYYDSTSNIYNGYDLYVRKP